MEKNARFVSKMDESSQLILSLNLIIQIAWWQFDTWIHNLEQKAFFGLFSAGRKIWEHYRNGVLFRIARKSFLDHKHNIYNIEICNYIYSISILQQNFEKKIKLQCAMDQFF